MQDSPNLHAHIGIAIAKGTIDILIQPRVAWTIRGGHLTQLDAHTLATQCLKAIDALEIPCAAASEEKDIPHAAKDRWILAIHQAADELAIAVQLAATLGQTILMQIYELVLQLEVQGSGSRES